MLEKFKRINVKTAAHLAITYYVLVIILHILIITGVVPYTWVNGGRSASFDAQVQITIANIIIAIAAGLFIFKLNQKKSFKHKKVISMICWFLVVFWVIGFLQQILGTPFEKYVCSLLLLLGVVSHARLALEKR